jgi:hypothetical protein
MQAMQAMAMMFRMLLALSGALVADDHDDDVDDDDDDDGHFRSPLVDSFPSRINHSPLTTRVKEKIYFSFP